MFHFLANAQLRQVFVDNVEPDNEIFKSSFFSASEGYVGFRDWIGYTADSGRNFIQKHITLNNVNYDGYGVNLTFGFFINGVKAFNQNTVLVYGHYGLVPSILRSTDGGNTFTLVFHDQYDPMALRTGITDMIFPQNSGIGYAVDADRVLKTTDQGINWSMVRNDPGAYFTYLEALNDNSVFAMSTESSKLIKTSNGGTSWQTVTLPTGSLNYAYFLNSTKGWVSVTGIDDDGIFYTTNNGGGTWTQQNHTTITPFACYKMKFINDSTGFALGELFQVFKTTNGGAVWEPVPRDNAFTYINYSHNDIQFWNNDQFWVGGGHGFLEININAGGPTIPQPYFVIDTAGVSTTGNVNLISYSRPFYTHEWYKDGVLISNSVNANYVHNPSELRDTITLIVSNGMYADTATQFVDFLPPVIVSSFTPTSAAAGGIVMISGQNFVNVASVSFGGTNAGFTVLSPTSIRATVGSGSSGDVRVVTMTGAGSLPGFTFIPAPTIFSFTPLSATAGTTVTITGANFINVTSVRFAGIEAASFNVVSSTTITAVTPSGASGLVFVTAIGGYGSKAGFIALPTITSFTPSQGTLGTILKITGTSLTETNAITVAGVAVQSFIVNSSSSVHAVVGAGGTGNVVLTTTGGSSTLGTFNWYPPPTISSFSPASGPNGTTVIISGAEFHPTPANNTVYFGTIRASITAGTTTSLTVLVPPGVGYEFLRVVSNGLSATSSIPFAVTFPNGGSINPGSFEQSDLVSPAGIFPASLNVGDLDGDGKPDLAVTGGGQLVISQGVTFYLNTSAGNTASFASGIHYAFGGEGSRSALGDIDGDGKLDVATNRGGTIAIQRNISTIGNLSFAPAVIFPTTPGSIGIAIGDIDLDGKLDIVIPNSAHRNISDPGDIALAPAVNFTFGGPNILLRDLNGDNKPELIGNSWNSGSIFINKNNSSPGLFSFSFQTQPTSAPVHVTDGDIDGDSKPDLIAFDIGSSRATIFKNTSSSGNITFANAGDIDVGYSSEVGKICDLDGDGKPDLAVSNGDNRLSVLKNMGSGNTILFAPGVNFDTGYPWEQSLVISDINLDGKPDPIVMNRTPSGVIALYKNIVSPAPFIASFTPTNADEGMTVQITGANFNGVTGVTFGGTNAASFTVNSPTSISAIVGPGSLGNVAVTNNFGTGIRPGFSYGIPPVISSFLPDTGAAGSTISILGSRFSPVAADNVVFFGAVRATVTAATATSLIVIVPTGASVQPVTVTVRNLTAYSPKPFNITFPGASSSFTSNSFAPKFDRDLGGYQSLSDIDGDGKADLVLSKTCCGLCVAKNTGTPGSLSFLGNACTAMSGTTPTHNTTADFDGDGKPDVALINYNQSSISVFRNTSSGGAISFAPRLVLPASGPEGWGIEAKDLDGDGRPDIVVSSIEYGDVSIYRNMSTPGNLVFSSRLEYAFAGQAMGVEIGDLDGDGKPEIVAAGRIPTKIGIFPNNSTLGTITFGSKIEHSIPNYASSVSLADLDKDGKLDIAVSVVGGGVCIFRNTSVPGSISFAARQDFATYAVHTVVTGDLDGDNKPEVVAGINSGNTISVFKNRSTPGIIILDPPVHYSIGGPSGSGTLDLSLADVDSDGIPDIVAFVLGGTTSILRNKTGFAVTISLCAPGSASFSSNISGASYQWQQSTGGDFVNIANNANFSGTNTSNLQLSNIPSSWAHYKFRCVVGSNYSDVFVTKFINNWTGAASNDWENPANWSCGHIPDNNTDVVINSGTVFINTNIVVRSLTVGAGASCTISTGGSLTVLH